MRKEDTIFATLASILLFPVINCYFINEVVDGNPFRVEVYNKDPSNNSPVSELWVMTFDENMNLVGEVHLQNLSPFILTVVDFPISGPFNMLLILTSSVPFDQSVGLNAGDVKDTFVFRKCPQTLFPFNTLAPIWSGEPATPNVPSIGRCSDLENLNFPNAFLLFNVASLPGPNAPGCNDRATNFERFDECVSDVTGDPHLVQTFVDKKTKRPINVCYDVTGQSQQSIFILQDHFTQTKVEGVLLDDYYMHQIKIHHQSNLLKIDRQTIDYNGRMLDLLKSGRLIFDDVLVDMEDDTIRVKTMNGEHELITNIKKVVNNFGIEHFDVGFENMEKNVERYGGLLGDIGKKELSVLNVKMQKENSIVLEIDNETIVGRSEKRSKFSCILLPFDKLIKPEMKQNYIY